MAKSIQHNVAYVACGSGCASAGGDARCSEGCIGCGACVTACPHGAIALIDGIARVDAPSARAVACAAWRARSA